MHDQESRVAAALQSAQRGDEAAFRELYRDVQPRLLRYLRGLVGDDADDVASETWLQATRDLARFQGDLDAFRGWASTIARHRALDHLRRQRRQPQIGGGFEDLLERPSGYDTADAALEAISTDTALALISALPPDQAEAILLRVVIGLDAKSAGRILDKRPGAVRTASHRGLNRLAERLAGPDVTKPKPPALKEAT